MKIIRNLEYSLKFKDSDKDISNTTISTFMIERKGGYVVEFWDVTKNYHSLKILECELDELRLELKQLEKTKGKKSEEYLSLKSIISFEDRYKNKRKIVPIDEFNKLFEITQVTQEVVWESKEGFLKHNNVQKLDCATMTPDEVFDHFYKNRKGIITVKY